MVSSERMCDNPPMDIAGKQMRDRPFVFERGRPRVRALDSEREDGAAWLRVSPQRRIEAVEFLRADFAGVDYATQRLSRLLVIARQT